MEVTKPALLIERILEFSLIFKKKLTLIQNNVFRKYNMKQWIPIHSSISYSLICEPDKNLQRYVVSFISLDMYPYEYSRNILSKFASRIQKSA